MRISTCRYRLRFKRPFTTAHGTRDGTDAVFVRIEGDGFIGHGEATLPPYVNETIDEVVTVVRGLELTERMDGRGPGRLIQQIEAATEDARAARNALLMAVLDLVGSMRTKPMWEILGMSRPPGKAKAMVTLAVPSVAEVAGALKGLPESAILKVKLGAPHDLELLQEVIRLDDRELLLDANQGLRAVDQALAVLDEVGERAVGIEQPVRTERRCASSGAAATGAGARDRDESIQGLEDLERLAEVFRGVNVKLMKCGGPLEARRMTERARQLGMTVMLGSMSESTLGSLAMLHLGSTADLLDLDGPWLIANDPFKGMGLVAGSFTTPVGPGIGALPAAELTFDPLCP
jgi:L-alanine-DL-glutamate epimerase-like enolase superfamily enzyme